MRHNIELSSRPVTYSRPLASRTSSSDIQYPGGLLQRFVRFPTFDGGMDSCSAPSVDSCRASWDQVPSNRFLSTRARSYYIRTRTECPPSCRNLFGSNTDLPHHKSLSPIRRGPQRRPQESNQYPGNLDTFNILPTNDIF
jgi:hypothetical protein